MPSEASGSSNHGQLSWRWHLSVFLAMLALAGLLLWGVYQPLMRQRARLYMDRGDMFLERSKSLRQYEPDSGTLERLDRFELNLLTILAALRDYEEIAVHGWPQDLEHPAIEKSRRSMATLEPTIAALLEDAALLLETSGQSETGAYLLASMHSRANNGLPRVRKIAAELVSGTTINETYRDLGHLHYAVLPEFIESGRKIQALFNAESSWDMAMDAYFFAIAFARNWVVPRLRMAELYYQRNWPEFAMFECLKVIRLDPASPEAERARAILASYDGKHPEADYYIGLAQFMKGDHADGVNRLRRFVARHPLIPNAPKAYNLLNYLDQGNEAFLRTFLRDEIWI